MSLDLSFWGTFKKNHHISICIHGMGSLGTQRVFGGVLNDVGVIREHECGHLCGEELMSQVGLEQDL